MQIKPLTNNPYLNQNLPTKTTDSKKVDKNSSQPKDKLELSAEALKLQNAGNNDKKLEEIKNKIANKFYESDNVINKVADNILKDLKKK
jgi:anti-sigma28 factor (negative regulator of flagellin synthesis)